MKLNDQGGLLTARQILWSDAPSEGMAALSERGRPELTVEVQALRKNSCRSPLPKIGNERMRA